MLAGQVLNSMLKVDDSEGRLDRKVVREYLLLHFAERNKSVVRSDKVSEARHKRMPGQLQCSFFKIIDINSAQTFFHVSTCRLQRLYPSFMRLQKFSNALMAASIRDCHRISSFSINKLGTTSATQQEFY